MSEIERRLMNESVRNEHAEETIEQYRARKSQEEKEAAIAREESFREDLLRELRIMNRLKAIEILTGRDITTLGQDYSFLIYVSTQKIGGEYDVVDHN